MKKVLVTILFFVLPLISLSQSVSYIKYETDLIKWRVSSIQNISYFSLVRTLDNINYEILYDYYNPNNTFEYSYREIQEGKYILLGVTTNGRYINMASVDIKVNFLPNDWVRVVNPMGTILMEGRYSTLDIPKNQNITIYGKNRKVKRNFINDNPKNIFIFVETTK